MHMPQNSIHFARRRPFTKRTVAPLGSGFFVVIAVLFSLLFILSSSLVFANRDAVPRFRDTLNALAAQKSGIVLLGENVDVDIDEPSVTIRWSVMGCGSGSILAGSPKLHGSNECGLPGFPLEVFVEGSDASSFTYDPDSVPVSQSTGQYIVTQAQVQFDQDIVLDVHDTRLYPFDAYLVSTALRVTSSNSSIKDVPVSVIGIPVIKEMPSFTITSFDTDISITIDEDRFPARQLEVKIERPAHARLYAMIIFGINWAFCHFSCGIALISVFQRSQVGSKGMLKRVLGAHAILIVIPQLRETMPDAPGLDGVLIDTIGYFPQMTFSAFSAVVLLLITAKRELDSTSSRNDLTRTHRANSSLAENLISGIERSEGQRLMSKGKGVHHGGQSPGHSRNLSMRDYVMEQVLKVLDAGSQALRSNNSRSRESLGVGGSGIGGSRKSQGHGRRSGSYHELDSLPY